MPNASIIWIVVKWRIFSGTGIRALQLCAGRSRCYWHVFALDLSSIGASVQTRTIWIDGASCFFTVKKLRSRLNMDATCLPFFVS